MADPQRARKLADRIKEVVARRIDRGLKDPRLGFVTITDVRVTGDLQHASIFYTVYGTDQERADTAAALKSATGMLRSEVGRNITARLTPSLEFIPDALPENAANIDDLLARAQQQDAETQRIAASAEYAGEADPYVKPRSAEDDDWDDDDLDDDDDEDDDLDEDDEEDDDVDDDFEAGDERDDEVYATDDLDPDAEFDDVNDAVVASDDDLDPDADDND